MEKRNQEMITRPLLAASLKPEELDKVKYPVLVSPKLDGIRILNVGGKIVTRKFKPLPNNYARELLEEHTLPGMDGELMGVGNEPFNTVYSKLMSIKGTPEFVFYMFDWVRDSLDTPYQDRLRALHGWHFALPDEVRKFTSVLPHTPILSADALTAYEEGAVELGYEGVMVRSPNGVYKCGRSTLREQILVKVKRFEDGEAVIIGFEEKMHNDNALETNELGYAKRSKKQEGMVGVNTLGALVVKNDLGEFRIGSGFDEATRKLIWDNQPAYLNKLAWYKHQPSGAKDLPRFPVYKGIRNHSDT